MAMPAVPELESSFPRVINQISIIWGSPECRQYLKKLVVQEFDRNREGFSYQVMNELNNLLDQHDSEFPQFNPPKAPFSDINPKR